MPTLARPCGAFIHYQTRGTGGIDVLLLAPGGMHSAVQKWNGHPYDAWASLPGDVFRVIGMDQRHSTPQSVGPIGSGWETYRDDQLALLDLLGVKRCLLLGSCIGPSFAFSLMKHSPGRFPAAVLLQPIGLADGAAPGSPRQSFLRWSEEMVWGGRFSREEVEGLRDAMYGPNRDFVFSVRREDVAAMRQPLLVFAGKDGSHPAEISREIAHLAPNAELVERWRDEDYSPEVDRLIEAFLAKHGMASRG